MPQGRRLGLGLPLFVLAAACCSRRQPSERVGREHSQSASPRNVVLILIDTLRQDHLKAYGYARETAPTLSRLASEGAVLDGLSPTSWTLPAVASLLTGLHPIRHQAIGYQDRLPEGAATLAERLEERGYFTLGVTANGFSGAHYGLSQGFAEHVYLADAGHGPFASAGEVDDEVFRRIGSLRAPYLLFVHYLDPHAPYEPPDWDDAMVLRRRGPKTTVRIQDLEQQTFMSRPRAFLDDAIDAYDGEIRRADRGVDALLRRLEERGLLQEALTLVVSDHGEEFEEHGRMGHGQTLYEEVVRVPILVHCPGVIPAGSRPGGASLLDVLPTVLDLVGVPYDGAALDGRSLARSLREGGGVEGAGRPQLLHLDVSESHRLALRGDGRKLLVGRYPQAKELFDLASDPGERTNLISSGHTPSWMPDLAAGLVTRYDALVARRLPRVPATADPQQRQALAAIGYVGGVGQEQREIPERIRPATPAADGLIGWEEPRSFKPCFETSSLASAGQLLDGWYAAAPDGRWTWPAATAIVILPRAPQGLTLEVAGTKRDAASARLRLSLDERVILDQSLPKGPFDLKIDLGPRQSDGVAHLRIERTPAYLPATMGLIERLPLADSDHRQLGVFVGSVCVRPARDRVPH